MPLVFGAFFLMVLLNSLFWCFMGVFCVCVPGSLDPLTFVVSLSLVLSYPAYFFLRFVCVFVCVCFFFLPCAAKDF